MLNIARLSFRSSLSVPCGRATLITGQRGTTACHSGTSDILIIALGHKPH